jgi:hypothetical protein
MLSPVTRLPRLGRAFAALFVLVAAAGPFSACGSDDRRHSNVVVGDGDQDRNGDLSVDESAITGNIEDGYLKVDVPVTSLVDKRIGGKLKLRLLSVDGERELGTVDLPYDLEAEASDILSAELQAPDGIELQSDLVRFNVRVDDNKAGGLRVTRSLMYVVPLYDLRLEGPGKLRKGRSAAYRVRAENALNRQPLEGLDVTLEVLSEEELMEVHEVVTGPAGDAEIEMAVGAPGELELRTSTRAHGTRARLVDRVTIEDSAHKLLLTTDKPVYQPGQIINLRSLSLSRDGNQPLAGADLTFEIEDGKGNKVLKKNVTTDEFGVAFTRFRIGSIVNEGTYKVRVLQGGVTSEKTVNVSHYALPKFEVGVETEEPWYAPGTTLRGSIDSRYFFGKPVTGEVLVEAYSLDVGQTKFQSVMGRLDDQGHYEFAIDLPETLPGLPLEQGNALIELRVSVTDSAGQQVEKSSLVTVSAQGASVALVPESTHVVPGVENALLLFASDPLGSPLVDADVTLTAPNGNVLKATTDEFGQATLAWTPPRAAAGSRSEFQAVLSLPGGRSLASTFDFANQSGQEHLLLRTDKSVYEVGETVKVDIISTEANGQVYVDWLNDGQTVDVRSLAAEDGRARFSTTLDTGLSGNNRIEAYLVDEDGNLVRTGRTIFVRSDAALKVEVSTDQDVYAPGSPAKLTLSVSDETGAPKVAALGLQIVDQAVFALVDAKPGLLRTYFELDDEFAIPDYEIHGLSADFSSLLFNDTAVSDERQKKAAQTKTGAALAAMKNTSVLGIQHASLEEVLSQAITELVPYHDDLRQELMPQVKQATVRALASLDAQGCRTFDCGQRSFQTELSESLGTALQVFDFWGNAFGISASFDEVSLNGLGADELIGTQDDVKLAFSFTELGVTLVDRGGAQIISGQDNEGFPGSNAGGSGNSAPVPEPTDGAGAKDGGPRVRRDFPETLYVNPSVITDRDGTATLDIDMADSITEWRVSTLANSSDGRLGGNESGIRVFQDFFVDVDFPASLTRGDEVEFPIAVYNYLDTPQTVELELQAGSWYTALGPTTASIPLEPGQVTGIRFPVRVDDVGLRTLTVVAQGSQKSDAVARTVRVAPDGKPFPAAQSGSLNGSVTESVVFPAAAVPGSQQLYVDLFPAFLSQVVQGMDSLLAEPTGCFEQTTSSAWPNVLVTEYMKETDQITPEIELKAEALMSAGYQRLLTFEHDGGGFSWFGEQDPAPFLSVTAFGLMEFSDMARVHSVDEQMIARTAAWLAGQQKPDGSFGGDMSEFFSFHTSTLRNTAFTAWALASAGQEQAAVDRALEYAKSNLGSDSDAYTLGILANAFAFGAPSDPLLDTLIDELEALKRMEGDAVYWDTGDTQTNFYGGGDDATVSATALVAHALLQTGGSAALVEGALDYLASKKDPNGNFGSTQATIWTLRALILAARKGTSGAVGELTVSVNDAPVRTVSLTEAQSDVMTRIDLSQFATSGSHAVSLDFSGTGRPSYSVVASHHLPWALVPAETPGPLSIAVDYDKDSLFVDEVVRATVTVSNNESVTQNMVLLTLGIPPGFNVETGDLRQYLDSGSLSKFEITGRQLILYLTSLAPRAEQSFSYDLRASMPVTAVDGGAEARLYYEPKRRTRVPARGLKVSER